MPWQLGITGGIGSGKSCVGRLLASYCLAPLVDVDQCCRQLLEIGQPGWQALRQAFDGEFFAADGSLRRQLLRRRLFEDGGFRARVDGLLHPLAREAMRRQVAACSSSMVLVEVPLLFEAGWEDDFDAVLVVYARAGSQCRRIMRRDDVSRSSAAKAIRAQMDLGEKARRADYIIDNSGSWNTTRERVVALGNELSERLPG